MLGKHAAAFCCMHPACLAASPVKQWSCSQVSWPLQLMALPEDKQLETLLDYMVAQASDAAGIEDLRPDQPLLELGLDSLRAAQFAVQVAFRITLPCSAWRQWLQQAHMSRLFCTTLSTPA